MLESDSDKTPKTPASTRRKATRSRKPAAPAGAQAADTPPRKSTRRKTSAKKTTPRTTAAAKATPRKRKTSSVKREGASRRISVEERRRLIAEKAYLLAEARGFQGGSPHEDWLAAEAEIDARLLSEGVRIE